MGRDRGANLIMDYYGRSSLDLKEEYKSRANEKRGDRGLKGIDRPIARSITPAPTGVGLRGGEGRASPGLGRSGLFLSLCRPLGGRD